MSTLTTKNALRDARVFANLPDEMLDALALIARSRDFKPRETIFSDGDPCAGFYLLSSGAAKLYKLSPDGREHVLHMVYPGETFAEAALFLEQSYPAYAEAIRPSRTLLFPKDAFLQMLQENPDFALRLLGGMALWLRRLVSQVEVLALRDASSRLAHYLRDMQQDGKVVFEAPKAMVASHLGMSPETLSRLFCKLEGEGVIRVQGRKVTILDDASLEAFAAGQTDSTGRVRAL